MKVSILLMISFGLLAYAFAQYNYPKPTTFQGYSYPKPTQPPPPPARYLPPPPPTTTTRRPYVAQKAISPYYAVPDSEYSPGDPYDFTYSVKDAEYGNDYGRNEVSDGENVRGEYRTLMPDGRTQIVRYTADWKNGFQAEVTYA